VNETDLLHLFMVAVPAAFPDVRVFRRNIINRTVEERGRVFQLKSGIPGQADAYAIVKGGRHVEIETKSARGTMRDAQEAWREWCLSFDVPHLVLRAGRKEGTHETIARWLCELGAVLHAA
jgi:hypothetical protein